MVVVDAIQVKCYNIYINSINNNIKETGVMEIISTPVILVPTIPLKVHHQQQPAYHVMQVTTIQVLVKQHVHHAVLGHSILILVVHHHQLVLHAVKVLSLVLVK